MKKLLIIAGATATGKSALAAECAHLLNSEVISADSMQIYKGMDIGTAKPSESEMAGVPHRMIDVFSPFENVTVSDYAAKALPIVDELLNKGKVPVICGGTGFYINSIIYDLSYGGVGQNCDIRHKYEKLLKDKGTRYIHDMLKKADPKTAEKLHPNDSKRVIRALEIFEAGGVKKSEIRDDLIPRYDYSAFCIDWDRETLYRRIDKRVEKMFEQGLLSEVKKLVENGLDLNFHSMQGIGYKETCAYLKDSQPQQFSDLKELIKKNTRNYAKRQLTFFKRLPGLVYLKPQNISDLAISVINSI